ncbi:predicted protein [Naegleria gruberi]|uniref:Predicted protein n=1 Tax=Naegleria gruberi TaxID=5762 RepID=D2VWD5_NAEGR|nr:uncharacterized protein NAEGRDRAFT_52787 [Naegleria gruberi]EFC38816.1 predicted protein [Naegleria gruberi]|eukprot:XP_002671560.1 predicted protein [Naegleria gruberi strain NEG-M]
MQLELTEEVRTLISEILEDAYLEGDTYQLIGEIYETYLQFSEEMNNNETETLDRFITTEKGTDDLTSLFKLLYTYDSELDESFGFQHGEIPLMLMKPFMMMENTSPNNCNLIFRPFPKFKKEIPSWIFKYSFYTFETVEELPLNDFLETFFVFLSHFERRFWGDETLCPKWGEAEQILFDKCMTIFGRIQLNTRPKKHVEKFELLKLIFEHLENTETQKSHVITYFSDSLTKLFALEFEKLKYMERNEERAKRLEKTLSLMEGLNSRERTFLGELFSIVGDSLEDLEIRHSALRLTQNCSFSVDFLSMCAKCCDSKFPKSIIQTAFQICVIMKGFIDPDRMSMQDSNELSRLLVNAAINFNVENVANALTLFTFIILRQDFLFPQGEDELVHIIYLLRAGKYISEIRNPQFGCLAHVIRFIYSNCTSGTISIVLPRYFEEIKKNTNAPTADLVEQLAEAYLTMKKLISLPLCSPKNRETLNTLSNDIILYVYEYFKNRPYVSDNLTRVIISNRLYHDLPKLESSKSNLEVLFTACANPTSFRYLDFMNLLAEMLIVGLPVLVDQLKRPTTVILSDPEFSLIQVGLVNLVAREFAHTLFYRHVEQYGSDIEFSNDTLCGEYSHDLALYGFLLFMDDLLEKGCSVITLVTIDIDENLKYNSLINSIYKRVLHKISAHKLG